MSKIGLQYQAERVNVEQETRNENDQKAFQERRRRDRN